MLRVDLRRQRGKRRVVVHDHVVGGGEARFARCLARDDREHLIRG